MRSLSTGADPFGVTRLLAVTTGTGNLGSLPGYSNMVTTRSKTTENGDDSDIDASFVEITSVCKGIIDDLEKTLGCDAIHNDISDGDNTECSKESIDAFLARIKSETPVQVFTCDKCEVLLNNDDCIGCDGECNGWFHPACVQMDYETFKRLSESKQSWSCNACVRPTPSINTDHANDISWGNLAGYYDIEQSLNTCYTEIVKWQRNFE